MDITPIYELRSRLRTAMIAGTNLLSEDFRLKRAAEDIKPLEQVSPVFAKIGELTRNLLTEGQEDKEGALLDTITLVDAVLCTQGQVSVSGKVEPVAVNSWGTAVTNAPYSVVKTLVDALTNSGNGHYQYVMDTHQNQPELFNDYRVKAAMVQALGASYAELAEQAAMWLKEDSEGILPLLQNGFDPKGKKEMVRRVQVMEAVGKEKCNDFYREMLPKAEKDVYQALIYALRHSADNVELLTELVKTEKGNAKKTAYCALACLEDERAADLFQQLYAKKPADAMEYLMLSETTWASALVAECLKEQLLPWTGYKIHTKQMALTKEQAELFSMALKAVPGKNGVEICEALRMAADIKDTLDCPVEGTNQKWEINMDTVHKRKVFSESIPYCLCLALFANPDENLCSLAVDIYEGEDSKEKNIKYFSAAFVAKVLNQEDCCEWLEEQLFKKVLSVDRRNLEIHPYFTQGLGGLCFDKEQKRYIFRAQFFNDATGHTRIYSRPVNQDITGRFTDILTGCGNSFVDDRLKHLINPEDKEYCHKLEEYFYKRALTAVDNRIYLSCLKQCGCTRCDGLLVHYIKSKSKIQMWEIYSVLTQLPGNDEAIDAEAKAAQELIMSGKVRVLNWNEEQFWRNVEHAKSNSRNAGIIITNMIY